MRTRYELTFVDAIKGATAKAVLLEIEDEQYWCPRSLIQDGDDLSYDAAASDFGNTSCDLYIVTWWLKDRGLY